MTFKLNKSGMGDLLKSRDVEAVLIARAEEAEAEAAVIAPEGWTGHYRESFEVGSDMTKKDRVRAYLRNTADEAMAVEFGAGQTPRHRVLGKSVGLF